MYGTSIWRETVNEWLVGVFLRVSKILKLHERDLDFMLKNVYSICFVKHLFSISGHQGETKKVGENINKQ